MLLLYQSLQTDVGVAGDAADLADMRRSKLHTVWVHVPRIDETFGFFRAATGIGRVDQAALIVHEMVQVSSCARQTLSEVFRSYLEYLTADTVSHSKDLCQDKYQPLIAVETQKHTGGTRYLCLFNQERHLDGTDFGSGRSRSGVPLIASA